jgi:hypothetical protein
MTHPPSRPFSLRGAQGATVGELRLAGLVETQNKIKLKSEKKNAI